jgi:hypothetical protein
MLSIVSVLTSLLLAGASASPLQVRAGTCNPVVAGKGINIVNGQFQLGYPPQAYFSGVPIEAEPLTVPLVPVFSADSSGNGLLRWDSSISLHESRAEAYWIFFCSVVPPPGTTTLLYPTNVNRAQIVLGSRITTPPGNS